MTPERPRPPRLAPDAPPPPRTRRSVCAADARRKEAARMLALSPSERVRLALELGERYASWAGRAR